MKGSLSDIWNLKRRGKRDATRHKELVKDAIKKNSKEIIKQYDVVTTDGEKKVKVPIRFLEQYRVKYGKLFDKKGSGQGLGGKEGTKYKVGSGQKKKKKGKGGKPGDSSEPKHYEEEITIDEMVDILIDELDLPWTRQTESTSIEVKNEVFSSIEKKGLWSNLDIKKTLLNNIKKNIITGSKDVIGNFDNDDLRFKNWDEEIEYSSNAAIYMLMDCSGSMSFPKKDIAKTFYFWMVQFIRRKYKNVELVFIVHDYSAHEVTEQEFFTISSSGGTRCSSAFKLALDIMQERHDPKEYNNYVFEFSDGDNSVQDNKLCLEYVNQLLPLCRAIGYGEIILGEETFSSWVREDDLLSTFLDEHINRTRFVSLSLNEKSDVFKALKQFFNIKSIEQEA